MFTLRFIRHGGRGYTSYACQTYTVQPGEVGEDDFVEVVMHQKDGERTFEQVGDTMPYDVCYVTNEAGKTIDKINVVSVDEE